MMPQEWTDVENLLDLIDHIWIGLVLIAVAAIPSWFAVRNHKGIKKVEGHVANGHTTPMREDLDSLSSSLKELRSEMREDMTLIKTELSDIRTELRLERNERVRLDDRFEDYRKDQARKV